MAISSAGVGSGLDVASLVSQLMQVERQPITALETKQTSYKAKISAFGSISSAFSSLQTAAQTLTKSTTYKATSGNTDVFSASVSGTSTTAGSYSVKVNRLSDYAKVATQATGWDASDLTKTRIQAGTLTFAVGTFADNGTAAADRDSATAADWTFAATQNVTLNFAGGSLQDLRDAINGAKDSGGTDLGLSAQIVSGSNGAQLVLSSNETGATHAFTVSGSLNVSTNNGGSYSPVNMGYNPTTNAYATATTGMREISVPWSAEIDIDGIKAKSTTNAFTDTIPGVTLNVKQLSAVTLGNTTATSLTIGQDLDTAKTNVNAFITAFNSLRTSLTTATAYDQAHKKAAALTGDSTARGIQSSLATIITQKPSGVTGTYSKLSEIGITLGTDGKLSLDSTKLEAAMNKDIASVQSVLSSYGTAVYNLAKKNTDSTGIIKTRTDGLNKLVTAADSTIQALERRMTTIQARLNKQFNSLDTAVSGMKTTSSFLTKQFG